MGRRPKAEIEGGDAGAPKRGRGHPILNPKPAVTRTAAPRPRVIELDEDGADDRIEVAPATARMAPRPPREAPREVSREPARRGAVMVEGRSGEQLTRRRAVSGDIFDVPRSEIPPGWDYQWNTVTVHEQEVTEVQLQMHANGWRPVPADRHPGKWTAPGHQGAIIVKGLRLEERPTQLGNEARAEDQAHARAQVRDQTEVLRLSKKLPSGMKDKGGSVRISVDQGDDIPRPEYQFEE